jgi:DNA-binding XRE family transcriptional regulator
MWRQHIQFGIFDMTENELQEFLKIQTNSSAQIISRNEVEVTAPDGEVFTVLCQIGAYTNRKTQEHELRWLEILFDHHFSNNKEQMINSIWRESMRFAIGGGILGISSGTRYEDRTRIGARIRQIREERGIEARDLAKLAGIDAANLSRIENGKYSVGLDILSKLATALGKKVDFVDI